jgi:hypothetical protein
MSSVTESKIDDDVFQIEAVVANYGFLPTYISETALTNKRDYPIIVSFEIENGTVVSGRERQLLGHLAGNAPRSPGYFLFAGGSQQLPSKKVEWVVKMNSSDPVKVTITASCKKGGKDTKTLTLK